MSEPTPPVLLNVDDDEIARYAKSRTLHKAGFEVIEAGTGHGALALVEAKRPALVLLDVRMPDISGIEVCKTIKQRWPATMVLQTSATFVTSADRVRGLEGGADGYLVQPIDPDELVASVTALLRLHAAESAAQSANEGLERRIEERTQKLMRSNVALIQQIARRERAEAVLAQAQKMEAVGQLTGAIAHDFNNVLAGVTGYLRLLQRKLQDPDHKSLVERAMAVADRGSKLTHRLLAFSHVELPAHEVTDVAQTVASMREWVAQAIGSGIVLSLVAEGDTLALTDADQLELSILNLALNARDAMPGGGTIDIEVRRRTLAGSEPVGDVELGAGDYVVVSVTDTGQGMPGEVASRAFEPFFSTKPAGRGTGLGLLQVYNLARQSNGAARLDSREGVGTCVEVWLSAAADYERETFASNGPQEIAEVAGAGESVLLVDDDAEVRRTLGAMLEDGGSRVTLAADALQGLEQLRARRPDVLVVDFAMPGFEGADLSLHARVLYPDLPIVFISAHAELGALRAAAAGTPLLRKPFRPEALRAAIRRSMASSRRN